jgi:hypothetical protein
MGTTKWTEGEINGDICEKALPRVFISASLGVSLSNHEIKLRVVFVIVVERWLG